MLDIAVEVPVTARVPLALVGVSEADGFTAPEVQIVNAEGDRFLVEVSQQGAVAQPDGATWKNAQQTSDELFRTWYGQDAYMAMDARRHFQSTTPSNP